MFGVLYGTRFGSELVWAIRNEGDRVPLFLCILCSPSVYPHWLESSAVLRTKRGLKGNHSTRTYLPMKMEQTECSETSAYKIQTPGNHPKESIQHSGHEENLKSRNLKLSNSCSPRKSSTYVRRHVLMSSCASFMWVVKLSIYLSLRQSIPHLVDSPSSAQEGLETFSMIFAS